MSTRRDSRSREHDRCDGSRRGQYRNGGGGARHHDHGPRQAESVHSNRKGANCAHRTAPKQSQNSSAHDSRNRDHLDDDYSDYSELEGNIRVNPARPKPNLHPKNEQHSGDGVVRRPVNRAKAAPPRRRNQNLGVGDLGSDYSESDSRRAPAPKKGTAPARAYAQSRAVAPAGVKRGHQAAEDDADYSDYSDDLPPVKKIDTSGQASEQRKPGIYEPDCLIWSGDEDDDDVIPTTDPPTTSLSTTGFSAPSNAAQGSAAQALPQQPTKILPAQPTEFPEGRQIAARGHWAEFATSNNRSYWMNVITKEKTWVPPPGIPGVQSRDLPRSGATLTRELWQSRAPELLAGKHGHIFVGGLHPGINELMFRQHFERFGKLVTMRMYPDRGYAYAQFCTPEEAHMAVNMCHKSWIGGVRIMVKFANLDAIR